MFNQWDSMSPMPEAVLHPAVAATNQRIYVFGGEDTMQNPVRIIQVTHSALQSVSAHVLIFPSSFDYLPIYFSSPLHHLNSVGVSHCQEHVV